MTPDAFEAVHNFILFSMDAQEKMGKLFSEEDLVKEIEKGESFLGIKLEKEEYAALRRRLESRFKLSIHTRVLYITTTTISLIGTVSSHPKKNTFGVVIVLTLSHMRNSLFQA